MFELRDKTGDITFNVGTKQIKAHKCVLAALSPKYMAQFYGEFGDAKKMSSIFQIFQQRHLKSIFNFFIWIKSI